MRNPKILLRCCDDRWSSPRQPTQVQRVCLQGTGQRYGLSTPLGFEAAFKTLKYAPAFPGCFESVADARAFCERFFAYYNHEHRHTGIALHTPASVHYGTDAQVRQQRQTTLHAAYDANPLRFGYRRPEPPKLPDAAWINQPSREALIQSN